MHIVYVVYRLKQEGDLGVETTGSNKVIVIIILEPSVFLELNYHEIVQDYYFFIQYLLETAYNSVL